MEKQRHLLIAEDDLEMRNLLRRTLAHEGYVVDTAINGREALEFLRRHGEDVDVLITDLRMPEITGERLLSEALSILPNLKVIVITGYSQLEQHLELMKKGAYEYLTKPFKIPDLLDVIDRAAAEAAR